VPFINGKSAMDLLLKKQASASWCFIGALLHSGSGKMTLNQKSS
jgi:hypothetical protein